MKTMTPEERFERIERTLEFLAANQAQLSASAQSQDARIAEQSKLIAANSEHIKELGVLTVRLAGVVEEGLANAGGSLRLAAEGIKSLTQLQSSADERIKALAESQSRTDERLNTLINVVERYFSNGHK